MASKRSYTIEKMRGVDCSSSPVNVSDNRASYMRNMIYRDGVNRKRYGWNEIAGFTSADGRSLRINGIFDYVDISSRKKYIVVHAGTEFYKCSIDMTECQLIKVDSDVKVIDTKSQAFYKEGILWIVGCGDLLIYNGTRILRAENSEYAYIPTTTSLILSREKGGAANSYEGVNLLNKRRKNRLIGAKAIQSTYELDGRISVGEEFSVKVNVELSYSKTETPYLAHVEAVREDKKISLEDINQIPNDVSGWFTDVGCNTNYSNIGLGSEIDVIFKSPITVLEADKICFYTQEASLDKPKIKLNRVGEITAALELSGPLEDGTYRLPADYVGEISLVGITVLTGAESSALIQKIKIVANVPVYEEIEIKYQGTLKNETGSFLPTSVKALDGKDLTVNKELFLNVDSSRERTRLMFCYEVPTPVEGDDNIEIEYISDYERELNITQGAVLEQSNGVDILCLMNDSNVIYFSDIVNGFGHIPDINYIVIGSDKEPITALISLGDSSLGVFKENRFYRVNFTFNADSELYEAELIPQIVEVFDGAGCVNQFVSCNVNADALIFNKNGVFGIEYSASSRSLKMRSSLVNKELGIYSLKKLSEAVACEHEGRYHLFIDGMVYIADSRFKVYESNRLDTSFEYEWWVWDGCPARVACSIDGKLFMGKENGKIAVFDDKFTDRSNVILTNGAGEFSYQVQPRGKTLFYANKEMNIREGDLVELDSGYSVMGQFETVLTERGVRMVLSEDLISLGLIFVGLMVYFESDEVLLGHEITDIRFEGDEIVAYIDATSCREHETLIADFIGKKYVAVKEGDGFCLIDERFYGPDGVVADVIAQCYACIAYSENLRLKLLMNEKNVKCEFKSKVFDLGSPLQAKSLWRMAITVSKETTGAVSLGFETNVNNLTSGRIVGSAFNLNNLDFTVFSFDGSFYKSYTKRVFERNFNYICFKVSSESGGDFAIESFSFIYSINSVLKGDR